MRDAIESVVAAAYTVPTEAPESDGTLEWRSTTIVIVEAKSRSGGVGLGYTYGAAAAAAFVGEKLAPCVEGMDAALPKRVWDAMHRAVRNDGQSGLAMLAVSAVDVALWDLKARRLGVSVGELLGGADEVPIYGSGGFTDDSLDRLAGELSGWVERGVPRVKMKTSRRPWEDAHRLDAVRRAIGDDAELYVDANGALGRKQALEWALRFRGEWGVSWFEEPVSSRDVEGLRLVREQGPAGLDVAAGEYGFALGDFAALLDGRAVDCLQADVTRCGGVTGLLEVFGAASAHETPLSAHCAPSLSAHAFGAAPRLRHVEYFRDHARIEQRFFDGAPEPTAEGMLRIDRSRPGFGLELRRGDAERHRVSP